MYKVTCTTAGQTYILHDPQTEALRVYDDTLTTESNRPGKFVFTLGFDHPHADKVMGLSSDIRVYDESEEIWRGRPIDSGEDLYRAKRFTCEGELAFLYDSIQPRRELHSLTPLQFLTLLLTEHNTQVNDGGPIDKAFRVGVVEITGSLDRYTNRETTLDCILDKLTNRLGGFLRVRQSGGYRYLDILADVDTVSDQPIMVGDNLLDYAAETDYTQIATACIPLGAPLEETEIPALDAYLDIKSVNQGSDTIEISTAVERFGRITKVVKFSDITTPSVLKSKGQEWLTDGQYASLTLKLAAVDLHGIGYDVQPLRVNTQVRVVSEGHGMDRYFPVYERTYHLSRPEADTVVFGATGLRSYTAASSKAISAVNQHAEQLRMNIDSVIEGERGNISALLNQATHGYVVLDPNSGPTRILIMDTNNIETAQKIWKWDMNGLGYSSHGIGGPWDVAITMNGEISADFIVTGELMASIIKAGILQDTAGRNSWNMETGDLSMSGNFESGQRSTGGYWLKMDTQGRMYGGKGNSTYGQIDMSASTYMAEDPSTVYHGIQLTAGVLRISTDKIAVAASDDPDDTTEICDSGTLRVVTNIHTDSSGAVTSYDWREIKFVNGLLTVL